MTDRLIVIALLIWLLFALVHTWAWLLLALAVGVPLAGVIKSRKAARHVAERQRMRRLVRHADEENRLVQEGSMAGIYGEHMPPPSMRGCGLWMSHPDE